MSGPATIASLAEAAAPDAPVAVQERPSWLMPLLASIAVALFAVAIGSWYPGDAPDYARFSEAPVPRPLNSGHLIWVPLARTVLSALGAIGISVSALALIQWMSALFTAGTLFGTWVLAGRLGLRPRQAWMTLVMLSGFAVTLLTGGAGGAISPMVTATVVATLLVSGRHPWTWWQGLLAVACMAFGWAVWGIAVFLIPVVGVAAFWNDAGTWQRRVIRSCTLMCASGLASLALAVLSWAVAIRASGQSFASWMVAASHGVAQQPSLLQFARGCYGSLRALVAPGDLGYSLKAMLLNGEFGAPAARVLLLSIVVALVAMGVVLAFLGLALAWKRSAELMPIRIATIALAAWVPSFLFAATVYGGNELHMVAGAAPFVALAMVVGLDAWGRHLAPAFAALIWAGNLGGSILPMAIQGGPLAARVGVVAREHLPAESAIVFFGQDITHSEGQIPFYHDTIHVLNIGTDVADRGVDGWDVRLQEALDGVLSAGGKVAVLSDLLERPTAGGIKVNQREFPRPSMADIHQFFGGWQEGPSFRVDRYTFVVLSPAGQPAP